MPEKDEAKKITLRSSKQEMLAALKALAKELEEKRREEQKPLERIEEKRVMKDVEEADSLSTERIAQEIGSLKSETGRILAQVSDRLEDEIARYERVKAAVEAKEKEDKCAA